MSDVTETLSQAQKHLTAGEFDQARAACKRLIDENGDDPRSYLMLGALAHKMGNNRSALDTWSEGARRFPENAELHYNIGALLLGNNSHKLEAKGREHLRVAVKLKPDWVQAWYVLGCVCQHIGPGEEAIACFKRVVDLSPDHLGARRLLAEVSAVFGSLAESKTQLGYISARTGNTDAKLATDLDDASAERRPNATFVLSRYPADSAAIRKNVRQAVIDYVLPGHLGAGRFISPQTQFFTLGSCFARHFAAALMRAGQQVYRMALDESINTTFANRYFMEWLTGHPIDESVQNRIEELAGQAGADLAATREKLATADAVVLTLGVAPCFFDRESGKFIMPRPSAINRRALAERHQFRTTSVTENVNNLLAMIGAIRSANPATRIFLTLSPVPMHTSFEFESAVAADCLSKSVLRVAVHEILSRGLEGVHYWPSFEMVRWLGAHTNPVYGEDDNATAHVNEDLVSMIVDLFIEFHRA